MFFFSKCKQYNYVLIILNWLKQSNFKTIFYKLSHSIGFFLPLNVVKQRKKKKTWIVYQHNRNKIYVKFTNLKALITQNCNVTKIDSIHIWYYHQISTLQYYDYRSFCVVLHHTHYNGIMWNKKWIVLLKMIIKPPQKTDSIIS